MRDKSLYLVSSADSDRFQNKLSDFHNIFAEDITETTKNYYIAVNEVFLDNSFRTPYCPKNSDLAPILCTTTLVPDGNVWDNDVYKELPSEEKIFLHSRSYANRADILETISEVQNSSILAFKKTPQVWSQDSKGRVFFGAFESNNGVKPFDKEKNYVIYVYEPLAKACIYEDSNQIPISEKCILNGYEYIAYKTDNEKGIAFELKEKICLPSYFDSLFFVELSICEPMRLNEKLVPYVFNATLENDRQNAKDETDRYKVFHGEVKHKQFYKIRGDEIRSIRVRLVNQRGERLMLDRGRATILHLTLKEEDDIMRNQFMVSVTSDVSEAFPNNTNSEFSTNIFPAIRFPEGSEWECSLVSCTIPTRYDLDIAERNRVILVHFRDPSTDKVHSSDIVLFPKSIHSLQEVVTRFNDLFRNSRAVATINVITGTLDIRSEKYKMEILVRADFYKLLGGKISDDNDKDFIHRITRPPGISYIWPEKPHFNFYFPGTLFCYFGSIEPVFIGNDQYPILRILQTKLSEYGRIQETNGHMYTYTFDTLIFHKVAQKHITRMDFSINQQSGIPANFSRTENSPTVLNLMFRRVMK